MVSRNFYSKANDFIYFYKLFFLFTIDKNLMQSIIYILHHKCLYLQRLQKFQIFLIKNAGSVHVF